LTKPKKIDLLSFGADDNGNAECMKALHGEELIYCPAYGWMHYTGTHWERTSDATAYRLAIDTLKRRMQSANNQGDTEIQKKCIQDERRISGCVTLYKKLATIEDASSFNADPDLVNVLNGIFNTRTGSLEKHKPCQRFTYCIPYEYKPDADMSMINDLSHDWTGSEEKAHYLQKLAGYSITGHFREHKAIYLQGPGRSGKTTFVETIRHLLGEPLAKVTNFSTFTVERLPDSQNFDLAPLAEARFVIASESNHYQTFNVAKLKEFTGGGTVSAAYKFHDPFNYVARFKLWFVSNHPPSGDPGDDALWARLLVMTFPFSHIGDEDPYLRERLWQVENMEGFLRWILEGAILWQSEGLGTPPGEVIADTQKYRDDQDYVKLWLNDEPCIKDNKGEIERLLFEEDDWESAADLTKSFKQWCNESSIKMLSPKQFAFELRRLGCTFSKRGPSRTRSYKKPETQKNRSGRAPESASNSDASPTTRIFESLPDQGAPSRSGAHPEIEKPQQNGYKAEQNGHIREWSWGEDLPTCPECGDNYNVVYNKLQNSVYCSRHDDVMQVVVRPKKESEV
jgi:putative DNA primase/helicase